MMKKIWSRKWRVLCLTIGSIKSLIVNHNCNTIPVDSQSNLLLSNAFAAPLCRLFSTFSTVDGDPGFILGCGHQLRPDFCHLIFQLVKLQLSHQCAEQDRSYSVGEPLTDQFRHLNHSYKKRKAEGVLKMSLPEFWACLIPWEAKQAEALPRRLFFKSIRIKPKKYLKNVFPPFNLQWWREILDSVNGIN